MTCSHFTCPEAEQDSSLITCGVDTDCDEEDCCRDFVDCSAFECEDAIESPTCEDEDIDCTEDLCCEPPLQPGEACQEDDLILGEGERCMNGQGPIAGKCCAEGLECFQSTQRRGYCQEECDSSWLCYDDSEHRCDDVPCPTEDSFLTGDDMKDCDPGYCTQQECCDMNQVGAGSQCYHRDLENRRTLCESGLHCAMKTSLQGLCRQTECPNSNNWLCRQRGGKSCENHVCNSGYLMPTAFAALCEAEECTDEECCIDESQIDDDDLLEDNAVCWRLEACDASYQDDCSGANNGESNTDKWPYYMPCKDDLHCVVQSSGKYARCKPESDIPDPPTPLFLEIPVRILRGEVNPPRSNPEVDPSKQFFR